MQQSQEADIITLHQGLLAGLREKANKSDALEKEIKTLRTTLEKIKNKAILSKFCNKEKTLKEIMDFATRALTSGNK
ncbi:hypothetical protein [Crenobacter cavernae]|uniref:hypothetical protein n=1 Tax=Crenobacter cavernae TaxID=2290923 RepID=UPI00100F9CDE|nr:hypothetical protein [Crenobacter cavernae]